MGGANDFDIVSVLLQATLVGSRWVLWLLLALSVASVAVIFDRLLYFRKERVDFSKFVRKLTESLNSKNLDQASALCNETHCLEAEVVRLALANRDKGGDAIEKSMSGYLAWQRHRLDRGLTFLGTLGNNAPFIGLFGTVLGIIQAFHDLAAHPEGGTAVVMTGISESLVATAVGLFVAIPAVLAYNTFQRLVKRKLTNVESVQDLVLMHFASHTNKDQSRAS